VATELNWKNETHWQTRDIAKLVRACLKHSRWTPTRIDVEINYAKPGNSHGELSLALRQLLTLNLPKRGPKDDPITMLATAAISDEPILAPSVVYGLARAMAKIFIIERKREGALTPTMVKRLRDLRSSHGSRARPAWLPNDTHIKRYAKKKAAAKKSFMEQVEEALFRAEARVEDWEAQIEHAESNLKRAQKDLKAEQKRLRAARTRAEERGESIEFVGPGHKLYGHI